MSPMPPRGTRVRIPTNMVGFQIHVYPGMSRTSSVPSSALGGWVGKDLTSSFSLELIKECPGITQAVFEPGTSSYITCNYFASEQYWLRPVQTVHRGDIYKWCHAQLEGEGMWFCDTMFEGVIKTPILAWQRGEGCHFLVKFVWRHLWMLL